MRLLLGATCLAIAAAVAATSLPVEAKLAANKLAANKFAANKLAANRLPGSRLTANGIAASGSVGDGAFLDVNAIELPNGVWIGH